MDPTPPPRPKRQHSNARPPLRRAAVRVEKAWPAQPPSRVVGTVTGVLPEVVATVV